jgi:hypothetical protein
MTDPALTYCATHPNVETTLRCRRCEKYICTKCAVRTPTGYICKECSRAQQKVFDSAQNQDYLIGFFTAAILSGIASGLISLAGILGYFGFLIVSVAAPSAGAIISNLVRQFTGRRRSSALFRVVIIGIVIGGLPVGLIQIFSLDLFGILFQALYLFLAASTAYYRLTGIQIGK